MKILSLFFLTLHRRKILKNSASDFQTDQYDCSKDIDLSRI
jgi:hypothetical protein